MLSKKDEFLEDWLQEFKADSTRRVYRAGLVKFKDAIGIEDLGTYVKDSPDVESHMRKLLVSLENKPSKTISTYVGAVKVFLQDKGVKVKDESWKKIRRRGYMPKRVKAQTQDKRPTKQQLKRILNYVDVKGKALILFLVSSGSRIGETLRLKEEDFDFEAEPPRVHIRGEITKGGVGERSAYFSFEARDAIKDWLAIKNDMGKRDGSNYKDDRVFSFTHNTAKDLWNRATDKAGLGVRDKRTGRRVYHIHSLRKFFRTKIGLDLDMTHALMGHVEYLDESYLRQEQGEIAKAYLEAMPNVSVYEVASNQELKTQSENLEDENQKLKDKVASIEQEMLNMKVMMSQILKALPTA
jgi:integrase